MYFQAKEKHLTPKKHYYPWRHNCFHVYPPSTVRELVSFGHVTWQDTLSKTILQSIWDGRSEPQWSEEEVVYEGEGANHKLRINLGNKPLLLGGLGEKWRLSLLLFHAHPFLLFSQILWRHLNSQLSMIFRNKIHYRLRKMCPCKQNIITLENFPR